MTTPIPQPPGVPFLGNVGNIESELPIRSFKLLAQQYGELYRLNMVGRDLLVANSYALQAELSNDKRFKKVVRGALSEVRNGAGDGLFTAHLEEANWGKAHRLLMPAFGAVAIKDMYDDMMDIASQLLLKWERFGPDHVFDPVDDYTKLTFDTIALCSMSHRLNSFYTDGAPPFVNSMVSFLRESFDRSRRPGLVQTFMTGTNAQYQANIEALKGLCSQIVADRKANGSDKHDLLDIMLNGKDPKTGEGLDDDNIMYNLITFLIAGHETTSGMLGFMTHCLFTNPEAMGKLRAEVDEVLGDQVVQLTDLPKMPYLVAVMREALRLFPTAPARAVVPIEDTTLLDGKYFVKGGTSILIQTSVTQLDPALWGEDAALFKPERMLDGKFEQLPANAWQPFGFGLRGCIGRPFAWQEAQLLFASIIQKFDLQLAEPDNYQLDMKYALTVKPHMKVRARPRKGRQHLIAAPSSGLKQARAGAPLAGEKATAAAAADVGDRQPMYVLYGSNSGSSEAFAQRIAGAAPSHGFQAKMGALDSAKGSLPTDGPVVIVTASYEGEPPDNAAHFVTWLTSLKGKEFEGVKYSVFGAGNRDWVQTYQKVPTLVDETLEARGAMRLQERGEGDAGGAAFFEAFDEYETKLWQILVETYNTTVSETLGLQLQMVDAGTARASVLRQSEAVLGTVVENKVLTAAGAPSKHHIEFELPEGMTYRAGDYLTILPTNPESNVRRVLALFKLSPEQEIVLSSAEGPTSLPLDKAITVNSLLSGYVELAQPATIRDIRGLLKSAKTDATRAELEGFIAAHAEKVMTPRLSMLDILEIHSDIEIPFEQYLQLLPAMRVRQYSISSSSLWNSTHATLTVSVINAPSLSGKEERFLGVGSSYLAGLRKGDRVALSVRSANAVFHLPDDPSVPVVMICAGSGLAPMRGFMQERALQKEAGRDIGRTILYFGCRNPAEDFLYSDSDLKAWKDAGVVDIRPSFSRLTEESDGCRYVQDRLLKDGEDLAKAYDDGAKFYVCGSSKVAAGVKRALTENIKQKKGCDQAEAEAVFERICKGRYATDIFE